MKYYLLFVAFPIVAAQQLLSQEEYLMHLNSIRQSEPKRRTESEVKLKDSTFIDYALHHLITPGQEKYISNRNLLPQIPIAYCYNDAVSMTGRMEGEEITIEISVSGFDTLENQIKRNQDDQIVSINGETIYGGVYSIPDTRIESIVIRMGEDTLSIPRSAYSNLYNPNTCQFSDYLKTISAYTSLDGKYIYLYIYGGNAADNYFSKLIFDRKGYVTKWVAGYWTLSSYGCFGAGFIGF